MRIKAGIGLPVFWTMFFFFSGPIVNNKKTIKEVEQDYSFKMEDHYQGFSFELSLFEERSNYSEVYFFRTNRDDFKEVKSTYIDGLIQKSSDSLYLDCFFITIDTMGKKEPASFCETSKKCNAYIDFMATAFFGRKNRPYLSNKKSIVVATTSKLHVLLHRFSQLSNEVDSPKKGTNLFSLTKYTEQYVKEWNSLKIDSDTAVIALEEFIVKTCACGENY
ncbi:MAG: hypothetical protein ACRBFS_16695 [Aureispira sp.]